MRKILIKLDEYFKKQFQYCFHFHVPFDFHYENSSSDFRKDTGMVLDKGGMKNEK
jgi:hypothetical protein